MNRFKDKVVLITGAAKGIGKTMAVQFAREGVGIFLVDPDGGLSL
jgi:NAD(P)-dependent dehydrogenase (short-subunit alcohol dehydrogenase family)